MVYHSQFCILINFALNVFFFIMYLNLWYLNCCKYYHTTKFKCFYFIITTYYDIITVLINETVFKMCLESIYCCNSMTQEALRQMMIHKTASIIC